MWHKAARLHTFASKASSCTGPPVRDSGGSRRVDLGPGKTPGDDMLRAVCMMASMAIASIGGGGMHMDVMHGRITVRSCLATARRPPSPSTAEEQTARHAAAIQASGMQSQPSLAASSQWRRPPGTAASVHVRWLARRASSRVSSSPSQRQGAPGGAGGRRALATHSAAEHGRPLSQQCAAAVRGQENRY